MLQAHGVPLHVAGVFGSQDGEVDSLCPYVPAHDAPPRRPSKFKRVRTAMAIKKHGRKIDALMDLARSRGATHLHAAFGGLPALLCAQAAARLGVSHSASVHANDVLCSDYSDAALYKTADRVFCCNEFAMGRLLDRSPWLMKLVERVPHGLDLAAWTYHERPTMNTPLRLLFVGRLVEKKDPPRAARLVDSLAHAGIPAELIMIGDGDQRPPGVTPLGFLPHQAVRDHMQSSDFLICTSREMPSGDAEGVPNVILEAMAVGLPVLSTISGSIGEVVSERTAYPINSDSDFVRLVKGAAANRDDRMARAGTARQLIEREWDARKRIMTKVDYFLHRHP